MSVGKKILVVVLAGAVAWAVYFSLYFRPKQQEIETLMGRLSEVQIDMQKKKAIAADLPIFNQNLDVLRAQLRESITQLPSTKNVPELLQSFSALAIDSGVQIQKFTVGPETVKGFYAELPINLELGGGYHNIAVFFDRIGKIDRIVNISGVQIKNPRVQEGQTIVAVTCMATTFRFLESGAMR
jgi:type IV pilus assembly protein PilO